MGDLGSIAETEAELIKRNREIAKVRDEVLKLERRLDETRLRNDDLLEKVAELDSEVTRKTLVARDLETKVCSLECQVADKETEITKIREELDTKTLEIEEELAQKEASFQEELTKLEAKASQVESLLAQQDQLQKQLDEEQKLHCATKASLEQSEASSRDVAGRATELRRRVQELESHLSEQQASFSAAKAKEIEEQRRSVAEIERISAALQETNSVRSDLEKQVSELQKVLVDVRSELQDSTRELGERNTTIASLEAELSNLKLLHEEALQQERRRNEEQLDRVTAQAADLETQCRLLETTREALQRSETSEAQMAAMLSSKVESLTSEHESATAALEQVKAEAAKERIAQEARLAATFESEQVILRRQARAEIDTAERLCAEAKEEQQRLQVRLDRSLEDHNEEWAQHRNVLETHRSQTAELRKQLSQAQERSLGEEREVERVAILVEEGKLESDRLMQAHKMELDRLTHMLEAEVQSKNSAEQLAQSKLEEKTTQLEHRESVIQRLQADLEDARRKMLELEEDLAGARDETETRASGLSLHVAELEGELKTREERLAEVEARLETQRQHLGELNNSLTKAHGETNQLLEYRSGLEVQLELEKSHKKALSNSLQALQDESSLRIKELDERCVSEGEAHRTAMDEAQARFSIIEVELHSSQQNCELLIRQKAELQKEVEAKANLEVQLQEQHKLQEQKASELENLRNSKTQLDKDLLNLDSQLKQSREEVAELEKQRRQQCDDFSAKVQQLDELLTREKDQREAAEQSLRAVRKEADDLSLQRETDSRSHQQALQSQLVIWEEKVLNLQQELSRRDELEKVHRAHAEELDDSRRKAEAHLRGEVATVEAQLRRVESEAQRAQTSFDQQKAMAEQLHAELNAKIAALQRQLADAETAKQAIQAKAVTQDGGSGPMRERLAMAVEELTTLQAEFTLEKQRLNGALEESRRTLRSCLGVPNPAAAVDNARVAGLEQQLSIERMKSLEQVVSLQRAERRCSQLEETHKRAEEQRKEAAELARLALQQQVRLEEELRVATSKLSYVEQKTEQFREASSMALAELVTVRLDSGYEVTRLRGALDELRYVLKQQDPLSLTTNGTLHKLTLGAR